MKISTTIKKEVIEAYEAAGFTQTNDGVLKMDEIQINVYDNYVSDAEGNEISYDEAVVDAGEF
jgi:hypothetical protein